MPAAPIRPRGDALSVQSPRVEGPNMSGRSSRPSFSGMSMRGSDPGPNRRSGDTDFRLVSNSMDENKKRERRASAMKNMSITGNLSGFDSLQFNESDFAQDDTGIKKMWTVMTKAKESGMTVDQIFAFFKASDGDGEITPLEFQEGLFKLGPAITKTVTEEELAEIFQELDDDGGGTVDIEEFKEHCYNIPRLAWKAEKIRYMREKAKSMEKTEEIENRGGVPLTPTASNGTLMHDLDEHREEGEPVDETIQHSEIIYEGTKLFWRTHEKVDVAMHEYKALGCIVLCAYNATRDLPQPSMIINKSMIEDTIKDDAVAELLEANRQEYALRKQIVGRKLTQEEEDEVAESVRRSVLSNYILLRLQQENNPASGADESGEMFLKKLHGDEYEEGELLIQNPGVNPIPEPPQKKTKVDVAKFHLMNAEIRRSSQELGRLSMSAKRMSAIVSLSMDAFGGKPGAHGALSRGLTALNVTTRSGTTSSIAIKKKVIKALLRSDAVRNIRKRRVDEVRKMLESSEWYQQLCVEMAERNASLAAEDKEGELYVERGAGRGECEDADGGAAAGEQEEQGGKKEVA